jgi:hypothetical protein
MHFHPALAPDSWEVRQFADRLPPDFAEQHRAYVASTTPPPGAATPPASPATSIPDTSASRPPKRRGTRLARREDSLTLTRAGAPGFLPSHIPIEDSLALHRARLQRPPPEPAGDPPDAAWAAALAAYAARWAGFVSDPGYRVAELDDVPWPVAGRFSALRGPEKAAHVLLFLRRLAGGGARAVPLGDPRFAATLAQETARWCPERTVTVHCEIAIPHALLRDCFTYMKVILDDFRAQAERHSLADGTA